jgi:hypothetical protein
VTGENISKVVQLVQDCLGFEGVGEVPIQCLAGLDLSFQFRLPEFCLLV